MSKISISITESSNNVAAARLISKLTGCSLETAKTNIQKGKLGFFYSTELFLNDHPDRAEEIAELVNGLRNLDIEPYVLEISPDDEWCNIDLSNLEKYELKTDVLLKILENAKGKFS